MSWTHRTRVFDPKDGPDWLASHAMLPVPYHEGDGCVRIFFAGRNEDNHSQIGYVDVSLTSPVTIKRVSETPVIHTGDLGLFDDSGVFPSSVVEIDNDPYLYYVGWMQPKRIRYFGSVGLAMSTDGGDSFEKASRAPLLPRNDVDPYMMLSSDVIDDDGTYRMWYTSTKKWEQVDGETVPLCEIKHATSTDGISWERTGDVCLSLREPAETRIACPSVRQTEDSYEMWYCYADGLAGYRVGYATSEDGLNWVRNDDVGGLDPSTEGWDSEMVAYPNIFTYNGETYLFYNGNGYGETGFGYTKLQ